MGGYNSENRPGAKVRLKDGVAVFSTGRQISHADTERVRRALQRDREKVALGTARRPSSGKRGDQ
jgi:U3 small nucleolar ribonucleoprotein component